MTTTKSIPKFSALRLKRSGQGTGYGERNKTKGSKISTGPTTSSRHSKNTKTKGTHFSTGPTTSSWHSKNKLKALILVLGLLQVVGIVKTKGSEISTGPTTSSRHSNKTQRHSF